MHPRIVHNVKLHYYTEHFKLIWVEWFFVQLNIDVNFILNNSFNKIKSTKWYIPFYLFTRKQKKTWPCLTGQPVC